MVLRSVIAMFVAIFAASQAGAQSRPSECLAIARNKPLLHFAALKQNQARLVYAGHSTFIIESPAGIRVATDYSGHAGGITPDVATMNHAHSSHYTDFPDPSIKQVLKGWGEGAAPARHNLTVGDVRIRNVATDIRSGELSREKNGNSIFIFEMAGLCIGHLGHLHHELAPEHIGAIGRLDVVMVPVDGGLTMPVENMMAVLRDLRARVILPMHARFSGSLERFQAAAAKDFRIERLGEDAITVSPDLLPASPTVYIMPGM